MSAAQRRRRRAAAAGRAVRAAVGRSTLPAALAFALLLAGCAGDDGEAATGVEGPPVTAVQLPQAEASSREKVPSAVDDPAGGGLPEPLIDADKLLFGGPPPDGIPAIDAPKFLHTGDVTFLHPAEPVLALEVGGETRAYPVQIMMWHEIVNDTIRGVPVAVTYCPLCNSALAFDRRAADRVLDFGVSGLLYNSDLAMFDRQTQSLWPQIEGRAVAGVLTGTELTRHVVTTLTLEEWRSAHPDDWVLSRDTGHQRDYGRNPYISYDNPDINPQFFDGKADPRLPPKTRVIGLGDGDDAVAVVVDKLAADRVLELEVAGSPVVLFARPGLASALDSSVIAEGRQVAATGAFEPTVAGQRAHFRADGDHFIDTETGSRWNLLGEAVEGPLRGERLTRVDHVDTFWFAWAAFQPGTRLIG